MATMVLPSEWTKPLVNSIVVPAHAQASAQQGGTGGGGIIG